MPKLTARMMCPKCKTVLNYHHCYDTPGLNPQRGDIAVCQRCLSVLMFEGAHRFKELGPDEIYKLDIEVPGIAETIQAILDDLKNRHKRTMMLRQSDLN